MSRLDVLGLHEVLCLCLGVVVRVVTPSHAPCQTVGTEEFSGLDCPFMVKYSSLAIAT